LAEETRSIVQMVGLGLSLNAVKILEERIRG